ncbi:glucosyl-3-phosphoglycerate synthase [Actinophytocola sp.]|uniref:glucosyl-3-phosphoglycerate synthase n=1 Tax=Actinophytocola sp. TaxID=1872138 RepID=UPI002EDBB00F
MDRAHALRTAVDNWLPRRSYRAECWGADELAAMKSGQRVSVVIPARNEERTVGPIVATVRDCLMDKARLVDELIVVDSRSWDRTAAVAEAAGATVVRQDDVLPTLEPMAGKGEALWKGLAASSGDLVAFVDGDLRDFVPHFVTGLLGPLLTEPEVCYVKGFYHRPLEQRTDVDADGGGRVTELVARPLLNLYWPQLAGFVQPLAGEYAGRRDVLVRLPFVTHYGVEIGQLVDLLGLCGLDALAQVDLGVRRHRHQSTHHLGVMSSQILLTVLDRLARAGRPAGGQVGMTLAQFHRGGTLSGVDRELVLTELSVVERPPLASLEVHQPWG